MLEEAVTPSLTRVVGGNSPLYDLLRAEGEAQVTRVRELHEELAEIQRKIHAINVLLAAEGLDPIVLPQGMTSETATSAEHTGPDFVGRIPPRKPEYENLLYRDVVKGLLAKHGRMTADQLTSEIFAECSPEAFKRAKNSLVGAISTEVRSGYFERPKRSVFQLGPRAKDDRKDVSEGGLIDAF